MLIQEHRDDRNLRCYHGPDGRHKLVLNRWSDRYDDPAIWFLPEAGRFGIAAIPPSSVVWRVFRGVFDGGPPEMLLDCLLEEFPRFESLVKELLCL